MSNLLNTQIVSVNKSILDLNNHNVMYGGPYDTMTLNMLTYLDDTTDVEAVFLLQCSETLNYIASFTVVNGRAVVTPNITIKLKNPNTGVNFKLFQMACDGTITPVVYGGINLILSFTKYQ